MASVLRDNMGRTRGGGEINNQKDQKERAVLTDGPELGTFTALDHLVLLLSPP